MKVSCTQENLNKGLLVVSHVASKSTSLPILNNILIKAEDGLIKLLSTNLEIGVSSTIRGKVEKTGSFTVQSRLLADYIGLLPKKRVDIEKKDDESSDGVLDIKCENFSTKIKGISAGDFPLLPEIERKNLLLCDTVGLKQAISQTIFAVAASETRPEIAGVLFSVRDDELVMAATDSYRLAEKIVKIKNKSCKNFDVIVPARTLMEILRILTGLKDSVISAETEKTQIFITDNQILFAVDNVELISRLVEGQYPDYKQIIPGNHKTSVAIDRQELLKAVKTTSLFTRSGIYDINLDFVVSNQKLIVSSVNNQLGENVSELQANLTGSENNIVINYKYLIDGLQNIAGDEVVMEMNDNSSPCLLKTKDNKDGYIYLIMPIKQ
ncbi:DNA polymerase III subunit beta [Candidatus Parcubacteria bacterium]|nr:MAG: DNA polymerase III subunit beta [Candidatus Parcubacteria bacterium]